MTVPLEVCRFCGLLKGEHAIRNIAVSGAWEMRVIGADGHLFELMQFPRSLHKPVTVTYQPFVDGNVRKQGEMDMTVLQRVQSLDLNRVTPDDMIDLLTSARAVKETYEEKSLPVPEALADGIRRLDAEIEVHRKDSLERRKKEIAAQMTNLESVSDKRDRLQRELAGIDVALGLAAPQVGTGG